MTSLFSRLQKLNKEATQLDWQVFDYGSRIEVASPVEHVCEIDASYDTPFPREQLEADAELIVECRNSLPAVLNLIETARHLANQHCREDLPNGERCHAPAEFVLWGKLIPPEGLGPRCYDHAAKHVGARALGDPQWAILDLRPSQRAVAVFVSGQEEAT